MTDKSVTARDALAALVESVDYETLSITNVPRFRHALFSAKAVLATAPAGEPPNDTELCMALRFVPNCAELPMCGKAADRIEALGHALVACVAVVKVWHGADVWDIYYNHSPEMKSIREALGA